MHLLADPALDRCIYHHSVELSCQPCKYRDALVLQLRPKMSVFCLPERRSVVLPSKNIQADMHTYVLSNGRFQVAHTPFAKISNGTSFLSKTRNATSFPLHCNVWYGVNVEQCYPRNVAILSVVVEPFCAYWWRLSAFKG